MMREFRAAWIASVANINWPSKPGLPVYEQKEEAIALLDLLTNLHYNAVILQVRPQCDALYASELEPWSYYLTGKQGQAPDPYYDPLEFWITEAHRRGLELHAWLNPYRAHHSTGGEISNQSIVQTHPHLVVHLDNGMKWLDPSLSETQAHSMAVIMDIVKRYDIDGIHLDDYFYPYPSYHNNQDFPDSTSWKNYRADGGKLSKNDWRRDAVNHFIRKIYREIKREKKYVKFGISPFGIWRPGHPSSIQGFDQYDQLYADAKLWLQKGWMDYFSPQLYWPINQIPQSFPILLQWWESQNRNNIPLWPGLSLGRKKGADAADETLNQVMITRAMLPHYRPGTVHWSIAPLIENDSLGLALLQGPFRTPALVPAMYHLRKKRSRSINFSTQMTEDSLHLSWTTASNVSSYIMELQYETNEVQYLPRDSQHVSVALIDGAQMPLRKVTLRWVDRFGILSQPHSMSIHHTSKHLKSR